MSDEKPPMEATVEGAPADVPPLWPIFAYLGVTVCSGVAAWQSFHMRPALSWAAGAAVCFVIARLGKSDKPSQIASRPGQIDATDSVHTDELESEEPFAAEEMSGADPSELPNAEANEGRPANWFVKLLDGDFGLAKTFWLFGVLGGAVWGLLVGVLLAATRSEMLAIACVYCTFFLLLFISGATWDAATKYKGNRVWAILAKVNVVASVLGYFINLYLLF